MAHGKHSILINVNCSESWKMENNYQFRLALIKILYR